MTAEKTTGDHSGQAAPIEAMEVSSDEFDELANTERLEATTLLARQYRIRLNLETALLVLLTAISCTLFYLNLSSSTGTNSSALPVIFSGLAVICTVAVLLLVLGRISAERANSRAINLHVMLENFFEKNPEIMFVKNLDGSFGLANKKFHEMVSDPGKILTNISKDDDLPAFVASKIHQQDLQVIEKEEPMEFHSKYRRDGDVLHIKTLRFPIWNAEGELIAVGGISSEISDQVQSRRALIENEQLLRTFIESAPDPVLICDAEGRITLVNDAAEIVFDYDRNELLELSLFDLVNSLNETNFQEAIKTGLRNGDNIVSETLSGSGRSRDNREFPVEYSLAPIITADGSLVICVLRDVSDKELIEAQLRQSQKMDAVGKLTGGMAHDFNNLLGIIIGNIALAKRSLDGAEPILRRLDTAMSAAERGAELTKRMLAVARRQPLQPRPVKLNNVIQELAEMLPQTLGADIELSLNLEDELSPILVDKSGVESMFLNLAINARDAMPQGGKFIISTSDTPKTTIEQALPNTLVPEEIYVNITVQDTGTGMSEEALNRAFEPFFTTKSKGKGTGLGLAMIYGFVKQSHGYIVVDSLEGTGTTINVYLPAQADIDTPEQNEVKQISVQTSSIEHHTVLVVDDEIELLEIAKAYLEDMGLTVLTAASGKEALETLNDHSEIELLLTDVVMPGMTGPMLVEQVRMLRPEVAILYASGFPSGTIAENSGTQLDALLIHKPYTRDTLNQMVLEALSRQGLKETP